MRLIKQLFIGIAMIATTSISAQSNLKFGHVNTQAIFALLPELKAIDEQLQAEYTTLEKQLTDMQEALKTLQQEYITGMQSNTLTPEKRTSMETQIQEGNQKVQTFYQQSQQTIQTKEQQLKQPLFEKVSNAIQEVGAENGFLYIFEEVGGLAVYKSAQSVDVSDLVKTKLGIQ
ncbi:OmpH family outer membrane protein [Labilibacter sediminis]|nr:OmpH family outer membrane protein [Labilibacter sediminis]